MDYYDVAVVEDSCRMSNALVAVVSYTDYYDVVAAKDFDDAYAWMVFVDPQ